MNTGRTIHPAMLYDVVVIGSGHAGCEAALAAARIGRSTLLIAPNLDRIGYMPCNPSIGGPGKSQIVAELDAMGGAMAEVADATAMQVRELNSSRGPAVRAVRVQCDKTMYSVVMKERLELQDRLDVLQDEATGLVVDRERGSQQVGGVSCRITGLVRTRSVVVTAGTFLRGKMIAGDVSMSGGRAGESADVHLAGAIGDIGFRTRRFKTGTPPRIDARSINYDKLVPQPGDDTPLWLSRAGQHGRIQSISIPPATSGPFSTVDRLGGRDQVPCFQSSTTSRTHDIIRDNLDRAPMYNGSIEGTGPRYCPSIEDKVGRYREKDAHPLFFEPEGWRSHELYLQGFSTSLPPDIQIEALQTIPGCERAKITRFGYAVEYDALDSNELTATLQSSRVEGLFFAGQVNGTSGYEEAAGQGILAGANAALVPFGQEPLCLRRSEAYIGVMIEDLVTRSYTEPYRMLTSRAEYRLILRSDTADSRLAPVAFDRGLIDVDRHGEVQSEQANRDSVLTALAGTWIGDNPRHRAALEAEGLVPVNRSLTGLDIARRPHVPINSVIAALKKLDMWSLPDIAPLAVIRTEIAVKYGAFIDKERQEVARIAASEGHIIPPGVHYQEIMGLRIEARQALDRSRPETVGQATRVAGVTPTDIGALLVHLRSHDRHQAAHAQPAHANADRPVAHGSRIG